MTTDFISTAAALLDRLRTLDRRRVAFGSSHHAYGFRPPLGMTQVEAFERTHEVSLPAPYRRYLTELGDGGAGPFYGIMPLSLDAPQLLQPFAHVEPFQLDFDEWEAPKWAIPGSVTIAEYGCGTYILLVVRGEAAGQVWVDARYETGIIPVTDREGTPMAFDTWWLSEMGGHLGRFERILALMEAATPHEQIHQMLEPGVLQLEVDQTMLSIMDRDPREKPRVYAKKPWGAVCGLVEDHYGSWLNGDRRLTHHGS
jgi:hypothetical protein